MKFEWFGLVRAMAGEVQEDSKVKVCRYPGKGNGLQNELSLEAGTSIVDEKPVAYIVCKEKREIRCAYCLGPSPSLKAESGNPSIQSLLRKCSKCKFVYYCGTTCQKKDWSVHKQECKNIIKVQPKRPPDICLLASRLVTVLVKKESMRVHSSIPGSLPLTIEHILPMIKMSVTQNNHMISEKRREMLITFAVVLQQFLDEKQIESCGVPYSDLVGFLCWLTCNCFNILDDDMNSIGNYLITEPMLFQGAFLAICRAKVLWGKWPAMLKIGTGKSGIGVHWLLHITPVFIVLFVCPSVVSDSVPHGSVVQHGQIPIWGADSFQNKSTI